MLAHESRGPKFQPLSLLAGVVVAQIDRWRLRKRRRNASFGLRVEMRALEVVEVGVDLEQEFSAGGSK